MLVCEFISPYFRLYQLRNAHLSYYMLSYYARHANLTAHLEFVCFVPKVLYIRKPYTLILLLHMEFYFNSPHAMLLRYEKYCKYTRYGPLNLDIITKSCTEKSYVSGMKLLLQRDFLMLLSFYRNNASINLMKTILIFIPQEGV